MTDASDSTTTITTTLTWRGDDLMAGVIRVGFVILAIRSEWIARTLWDSKWLIGPGETEARAALERAAERALRGMDEAEQPEAKSR